MITHRIEKHCSRGDIPIEAFADNHWHPSKAVSSEEPKLYPWASSEDGRSSGGKGSFYSLWRCGQEWQEHAKREASQEIGRWRGNLLTMKIYSPNPIYCPTSVDTESWLCRSRLWLSNQQPSRAVWACQVLCFVSQITLCQSVFELQLRFCSSNGFKSYGIQVSVELWRFPDRTTETGKMIDLYLQSKADIDDAAIHLLFSANRWEKRWAPEKPFSLLLYLGSLVLSPHLHHSS